MFGRREYNIPSIREVSREEFEHHDSSMTGSNGFNDEDDMHESFSPDCICGPKLYINSDGSKDLKHFKVAQKIALENNRMMKEILTLLKEKDNG